jgi:rRNA-processing protein EBP2
LEVPEALTVHDDIKREIAFYNLTRENVMKGMQILIQAKIPISRPDDFFAEMLKSDEHMAKVKSRLLQQQQKVQTFEEKKSRMENKKFHKAIKAYKQTEKHQEKRQNFEKIDQLKKKIKESKGNAEVDEKEFNKLFNGGGNRNQQYQGRRKNVIDRVKDS